MAIGSHTDSLRVDESPVARETLVLVGYFVLFMAYMSWRPEGDWLHWLSLVLVPLVILRCVAPSGHRQSFAALLASAGLRRGHLRQGLLMGASVGLLAGLVQAPFTAEWPHIVHIITSGEVIIAFPLVVFLLLVTAGFTEEFFFRGLLQTRLTAWTRSKTTGVVVTTILFGLYHLPYAYLLAAHGARGDWSAAVLVCVRTAAMGLIPALVFIRAKGNLMAAVAAHTLFDALSAMALINFGGGS